MGSTSLLDTRVARNADSAIASTTTMHTGCTMPDSSTQRVFWLAEMRSTLPSDRRVAS